MNNLEKARQMINGIDKQMAELFCERMRAAELVADYKKEKGLPILDAEREEAVIRNNCKLINDEKYTEYYTMFLRDVMSISRSYQHRILNGMRVAYSGVEGAFAHIAAGKIFDGADRIAYSSFSAAYNAVVQGECDCAVLPVENSNAGDVGQVLDLIFSGSLYINGIYDLSVTQNLLGINGAALSDIKYVISQPKAIEQCETYIQKNRFNVIACENTALAAKQVASRGDKSYAAIASIETAELYGLDVIDKNINENNVNTTRFAVLSRSLHKKTDNTPDTHSVLLFTVRNEASALAKAIDVIGKHNFNMQSLSSRSMKGLLWQYYFYIEVEGNLNSDEGKNMLAELAQYCDKLKVAGTFKNHIDLK